MRASVLGESERIANNSDQTTLSRFILIFQRMSPFQEESWEEEESEG